MPEPTRIHVLFDLWEQSNREIPIEELCRDSPELVAELRAKIRAVLEVESLLRKVDQSAGTPALEVQRPSSQSRHQQHSSDPESSDPTIRPSARSGKPISAASRVPSQAETSPPQRMGDYELIEELGRGGMGVVFRARHVTLNMNVALKVIHVGADVLEEEVLRFQREARAGANLSHPGIVPIFDAGSSQGHLFYSMALIDGENLAQQLSRRGPLPEKEAASLMLKVADAVSHAHSRGIIHRDLKPANVLINRRGEPLVTDFGLVKRITVSDTSTRTSILGSAGLHQLTEEGQLIGTPSFMSPEQADPRETEIGPPSDVYSMGCILYVLLLGHPPFWGGDQLRLIMKIIDEEPLRPREVNPGLSEEIEAICLKCLRKSPQLRYPTAAELASDLQVYLSGATGRVESDAGPTFGDYQIVKEIAVRGNRVLCEARHLSTNQTLRVAIAPVTEISVSIYNHRQLQFTDRLEGIIEFGRERTGDECPYSAMDLGDRTRIIIAARTEKVISRAHAVLSPLGETSYRLSNQSHNRTVLLASGEEILPGDSVEITLPLLFGIGSKGIRLEADSSVPPPELTLEEAISLTPKRKQTESSADSQSLPFDEEGHTEEDPRLSGVG